METILEKSAIVAKYNSSDKKQKLFLEELFGKETFLPKLEERLDSFETCCEEVKVDPSDYVPYPKPKNDDQKCINAFAKLIPITRAYNQSKKKDWKNSSQYKYYPWFRMDGNSGSGLSFHDTACVRSFTIVASRLILLERSHVEILVKKFPKIYEDLMTE